MTDSRDHTPEANSSPANGPAGTETAPPPLADARGTVTHADNEWQEFRGEARHHTVEVLRLIMILLQDSVILIAGFAVEYIAEHYLHSTQPFFRLAINISSAVFLLLYGVMVTVHVVNYVRKQFGTTAAGLFSQYIPWALGAAGVIAGVVLYNLSSIRSGGAASAPGPVTRLTVTLPPGQHLAGLDQPAIAISPDGKNLVYVASQSRARQQADTVGCTCTCAW